MMQWAVLVAASRAGEARQLVRDVVAAPDPPDAVCVVFQGDLDAYEALDADLTAACRAAGYHRLLMRHDHGRGASRARNIGLRMLPDDIDWAWTPNDTTRPDADFLARVRLVLTALPDECHAVAMNYRVDRVLRRSVGPAGPLAGWSLWRVIEPATIWRLRPVRHLGGFDERLGSGSRTIVQSGEGTDLLCRLVAGGGTVRSVQLTVRGRLQHLARTPRARVSKEFYYGVGFGYVARTHLFSIRALAALITPLIKCVARKPIEGERPRVFLAVAACLGRCTGMALGRAALSVTMRGQGWR